MKINPRKAAMIGLAASTMFSTTGCGFLAENNEPTTVYGPPEWFDNTDPSNNYNEDVYGPPEWFEEDEEDEENSLESEIIGEWDGESGPFTYCYYFGSDGVVRYSTDGGEEGIGSYDVSDDLVTLYLNDGEDGSYIIEFTYSDGSLYDSDNNRFIKVNSDDPAADEEN